MSSVFGIWSNRDHSGCGFLVMVLTTGQVVAYYFGHKESAQQFWCSAVGTDINDLPVYVTLAEGFPTKPETVLHVEGGSLRLEYDEAADELHCYLTVPYALVEPGFSPPPAPNDMKTIALRCTRTAQVA